MTNTDEMDSDIAHALHALDDPLDPVSAESIIHEARSRARRRSWRLAAAAVVMFSAAAVAALPASPARRWLAATLRNITSQQSVKPPVRDSVLRDAAPEMRGVSTQSGPSPAISFSDWQDDGAVVLRLIAESEMRIRSTAFPASYSLRAGNIAVRNPGSRATYEVDVSEGAIEITVIVASRTVFRRRNDTVLIGPAPRSDGAYVLSLQQGRLR